MLRNNVFTQLNENWFYLVIISFVVGIVSSVAPVYLIGLIVVFLFAYFFLKDISFTFLYMVFLLFLQPAVAYNIDILGFSPIVRTFVDRTDEFVWFLFLFVILAREFQFTKWEIKLTGFELPAALFGIVGILSMIVNHVSPLWGLVAMFLTMKGVIIFFIAKNLEFDEKEVVLFYKNVFYFLIVIFFIGLLQYIGVPIPLIPQHYRFGINVATSIFGHHAIFGMVMAIAFSLSLGIYFSTNSKKWIAYALIFFTGIILSTVRKSLIGITFGTLFVLLNYRKFKIRSRDIYITIGVILLFFGVFHSRFMDILEGTSREYIRNFAVNPRFLLYYGAYKIIKGKPLLGEGPGRYGSYVSVVTKSEVYQKYGIHISDKYKADTYWAYILGEYGLAGTFIIFLFLFVLFRKIWKLLSFEGKNKFINGLLIGYIILFVDYLFESVTMPIYKLSLSSFFMFGGIGIIENLLSRPTDKYTLE